MPCANTAREVYSEELEERFFAPDKIADEDLIALMLNWPADYKATLRNDVRPIARAKRVFAHALSAIEEALLENAAAATAVRPPKKTKPTVAGPTRSQPISMMTMAMSEGFSGVTEAVEDDDDDDDGETTAHKIDKLRAQKGQERAAEMAK